MVMVNMQPNAVIGASMRRILILDNGSILEAGIAKLLSSEKELEVLVVNFKGEDALASCLASLNPDIVILSRTAFVNYEQIQAMILNCHGPDRPQIIAVSEYSSSITVTGHAGTLEMDIRDWTDFMRVIIT
jgi:DNA-binding NarL/FixJ family response regulator